MPTYHITFKQQRGKSSKPSLEYLNLHFLENVKGEIVAYHAGKYLVCMLPYTVPATNSDIFTLNPIQIIIEHLPSGSKNLQTRKFIFKKATSGLITDLWGRNFTIIDDEIGKSINIDSNSSDIQLEPKVIIPNPPKSPEILTPMGGAVRRK